MPKPLSSDLRQRVIDYVALSETFGLLCKKGGAIRIFNCLFQGHMKRCSINYEGGIVWIMTVLIFNRFRNSDNQLILGIDKYAHSVKRAVVTTGLQVPR